MEDTLVHKDRMVSYEPISTFLGWKNLQNLRETHFTAISKTVYVDIK
jgi:hypothetical protein